MSYHERNNKVRSEYTLSRFNSNKSAEAQDRPQWRTAAGYNLFQAFGTVRSPRRWQRLDHFCRNPHQRPLQVCPTTLYRHSHIANTPSLATADQRMTLPGRIARALAVFSVDEVIVFDDSLPSTRPRQTDPLSYTGDVDPAHFLAHILSFLEAPPFMRKALFPLHPNLRLTALLPSLDMPHHPNPREWINYREGVAIQGRTSAGEGTLVEVGMEAPVEIEEDLEPKTRVTLRFPEDESQYPECVHPQAPRTEGGYYWGYTVRKCASLSSVFTESPFEDGYDLSIGTSERGTPISTAFPAPKRVEFKHMLIVLGGPRGLEFASMNDEQLSGMDIQGSKTRELFDHWINVLPNQGSRTIRTDEALFIALTALRHTWDSS